MWAELRPAGPMETVPAERIVSLSWRLKRAERMQNEALDCLLSQDAGESAAEAGELGSFAQDDDPVLGRAPVVALRRAGTGACPYRLSVRNASRRHDKRAIVQNEPKCRRHD
jgi:hypothetical protein